MNGTREVAVVGGVLLASPALWAGLVERALPVEDALLRLAVAVAVVWIGVSALRVLLEGTAPEAARAQRGGSTQPPESTPSGS